MVYIRTDANREIATGHVMRCLTIADELKRQRVDVCFVVSDDESVLLIREKEYPVLVMQDMWSEPDIEKEYSFFCERAEKQDIFLVDSYYVTNQYINKFKSLFRIMVFDDLFLEKKDADILINYNVFYRRYDYATRYCNSDCKLLLGEKYVPLRMQFQEIEKRVCVRDYDKADVLLICGGGDRQNMILGVLGWMLQKEKKIFYQCNWKVVMGGYYPNKDELIHLANQYENIEIFENISNMAEMMNRCDLCISAASTVLYECCAMMLPTMFFVVSEDQIYDAEEFCKNGMMIYCGSYLTEKEQTLKCLGENMKLLLDDRHKQKYMKDKMYNFLDVDGAKRIVETILQLQNMR